MTNPTLLDRYRAERPSHAVIDDVHEAEITDPDINSVDDVCRAFFSTTPTWLKHTMRFRNAVVSRLGFSAGDRTSPVVPEVIEAGQSFSAFKVLDRTETEIMLGGDDDRFSMRISMEYLEPAGAGARVRLATVAHHNDIFGRAYLALVKYPHGPIARMSTNRIARETP